MDKSKYRRKDWGPGQAQQSVTLSGFHCLLRQHHLELIGHTSYSKHNGYYSYYGVPILKASSEANHLPSTPLPDTLMLALKASACNLWETPCPLRPLPCLLGSPSMCIPVRYLSLDNVFIGIMAGLLSGATISDDFA